MEGDGILGNTRSVPTKVNGKYNRNAALVLQAVNELMQDPIIKEKMQACVRKENDILVTSLPGTHQSVMVTENSLTYKESSVAHTVVGDSDMSNFIRRILVSAKGENNAGLKFDDFEDKEKLKSYIMYLIEPDVTSLNRVAKKGSFVRKALDKLE